jgi:hypothetical protein
MIMRCFEGDVCAKIFDQLRLGPRGTNVSKSCVLTAFDQGLFGVAEDEVAVVVVDELADKATGPQFFYRALNAAISA